MIRRFGSIMLAVASLSAAGPASAKVWTLAFAGDIDQISDNHGVAPIGSIAIGDPFHLQFTFDDALAILTTPNPSSNQYMVPIQYQAQVGSYTFSGNTSSQYFQPYMTFYDNFAACGGSACPVDAAYFSQVGFQRVDGSEPFNLGAASYKYAEANFYDGSSNALSYKDLNAISQLSNFTSAKIGFGGFNPDTSELLTISASNAKFSLAAPAAPSAPAPLLGFGLLQLLASGAALAITRGWRKPC